MEIKNRNHKKSQAVTVRSYSLKVMPHVETERPPQENGLKLRELIGSKQEKLVMLSAQVRDHDIFNYTDLSCIRNHFPVKHYAIKINN